MNAKISKRFAKMILLSLFAILLLTVCFLLNSFVFNPVGVSSANADPYISPYDCDNLFSMNIKPGTYELNGLTFRINPDLSIAVNGTSTAQTVFHVGNVEGNYSTWGTSQSFIFFDGREFTLSSGVPYNTDYRLQLILSDSSGTQYWKSNGTFIVPNDFHYVAYNARILIESGVTLKNIIFKCQLEYGTVATEYKPNTNAIYNLGFESGYNLYLGTDGICNSNLIYNSDFSANSKGKDIYTARGETVDNWDLWNGLGTFTVSEKRLEANLSSTNNAIISQYLNRDQQIIEFGKTYTLTFKVNDKIFSKSVVLPASAPSETTDYIYINIDGDGYIRLRYNIVNSIFQIDIGVLVSNVFVFDFIKLEKSSTFTGWCPNYYELYSSGYNSGSSSAGNSFFSRYFVTPKTTPFDSYYLNVSSLPVAPPLSFFKHVSQTAGSYSYYEYFSDVQSGGGITVANYPLSLAWYCSPIRESSSEPFGPPTSVVVGYNYYLVTSGSAGDKTDPNVLFWGVLNSVPDSDSYVTSWNSSGWNVKPNFNIDGVSAYKVQVPKSIDYYSNVLDNTLKSQFGVFGWSNFIGAFNIGDWVNYDAESYYSAGYSAGYESGAETSQQKSYNDGHSAGYKNGYINGKNDGIKIGTAEGSKYSFLGLIGAVVDAPIQALFGGSEVRLNAGTKVQLANGTYYTLTSPVVAKTMGLFNFDVLGVDMSALVLSLFTLAIIFTVLKLVMNRG